MLRRQLHRLCWEVAPEFEPLLASVVEQVGEAIKRTNVTTVTRHRVAGRVFYLKRYRHEVQAFGPTRHFLRTAKSQREWKHAPRLQELGVRVVPHLAHGTRWNWRGLLESALVTEGMEGYEPLTSVPNAESPELQQALGKFIGQMHHAGVLYLDLAPQNILHAAATNTFYLIDVDKVAVRTRLRRHKCLTNLAALQSFFPMTDAFYRGYGGELAQHAVEVIRRAEHIRQARLSRWARHCLRHRNRIDRKRIGGLNWYVRLADFDSTLEKILANPEAGAAGSSGFRVQQFQLRSAKPAYRQAYHRELTGAATERPVAAADKRLLGLVWRSYLVTTSAR